jgi:hypothetical protein
MSKLLIFNEETTNVVDNWVKESHLPKEKQPIDSLKLTSITTDKVGLGFQVSLKRKQLSGKERFEEQMKKRQRQKSRKTNDNANDDDDDNNLHVLHGIVNDDIEESRTAISKPITKKISQLNSISTLQSKNNNLKNKKEEEKKESEGKIQKITTKSTTALLPQPSESIETKDSDKKKRTKTRSKQKNIRKDKRTDEQKPAHLRLKLT